MGSLYDGNKDAVNAFFSPEELESRTRSFSIAINIVCTRFLLRQMKTSG